MVDITRCNNATLPTRAPYSVPVSLISGKFDRQKCRKSTYNITVTILYEGSKVTPVKPLPLAFFVDHPNFTTPPFQSISMSDVRAYGIKSPQLIAMKNVFPMIASTIILMLILTVLYLFFEDPSWVLVKGLLTAGGEVVSPKGKLMNRIPGLVVQSFLGLTDRNLFVLSNILNRLSLNEARRRMKLYFN